MQFFYSRVSNVSLWKVHPWYVLSSSSNLILIRNEKIRKDDVIFCNQEPKVTRCCTCLRCSYPFFLNCKLPKNCTRGPGNLLFHLNLDFLISKAKLPKDVMMVQGWESISYFTYLLDFLTTLHEYFEDYGKTTYFYPKPLAGP